MKTNKLISLGKIFSIAILLRGANYKYNGKDRGFEAVIIAGQYWLKDNGGLWVAQG
ncbi:MAG: hypothetical protein HC905_28045 [Bacteroidales bacterium]|nr:hypothetical protein [Bacteroidales bacterium]